MVAVAYDESAPPTRRRNDPDAVERGERGHPPSGETRGEAAGDHACPASVPAWRRRCGRPPRRSRGRTRSAARPGDVDHLQVGAARMSRHHASRERCRPEVVSHGRFASGSGGSRGAGSAGRRSGRSRLRPACERVAQPRRPGRRWIPESAAYAAVRRSAESPTSPPMSGCAAIRTRPRPSAPMTVIVSPSATAMRPGSARLGAAGAAPCDAGEERSADANAERGSGPPGGGSARRPCATVRPSRRWRRAGHRSARRRCRHTRRRASRSRCRAAG